MFLSRLRICGVSVAIVASTFAVPLLVGGLLAGCGSSPRPAASTVKAPVLSREEANKKSEAFLQIIEAIPDLAGRKNYVRAHLQDRQAFQYADQELKDRITKDMGR